MDILHAQELLKIGKRIRHTYFTSEEWVQGFHDETGRLMYRFDDGCICTPREFWTDRDKWDGEWTELESKTVLIEYVQPNDGEDPKYCKLKVSKDAYDWFKNAAGYVVNVMDYDPESSAVVTFIDVAFADIYHGFQSFLEIANECGYPVPEKTDPLCDELNAICNEIHNNYKNYPMGSINLSGISELLTFEFMM